MILDIYSHAETYASLHPLMEKALQFLTTLDPLSLPDGRIELSDDNSLYASVETYTTKPLDQGFMEAHRTHIDIQAVLSGEERIGWAALENQPEASPFDPSRDIGFYQGACEWLTLKPGRFMILFPQDAHFPCRLIETAKPVRKIVIKIAV